MDVCGSEGRHAALSGRLLLGFVCALLAWSAWARAGTVVTLQGPLPWIGLGILGSLAFDRLCGARENETGRALARDVVFWAGLAFLGLLLLQWWNAGRFAFFHPFDERWVFTPPPHPRWPGSVNRGEAAEMLRWFLPAWALMLALRHARNRDWLAKRLGWFLICHAGLLAAFGIAQALSGTHSIFWITPLKKHFFASFGYENHAASYFALLFGLAAGMLLRSLQAPGDGQPEAIQRPYGGVWSRRFRRPDGPTARGRGVRIAWSAVCALLCLTGMALSFSQTGVVLAIALAVLVLLIAIRLFWARTTVANRIAVTAAVIMGAATFLFILASMGGNPLAKAVGGLYETKLGNELECRFFLSRSALAIWADHPWFGVGGWGYRHFLPLYAARQGARRMNPGFANVHNDAAQFLCEFGLVGFGLMAAAALAFAWPLIRRAQRGLTPDVALAGAGLLAVLIHSLIDLPFRSPAILYAWLAACGVAGNMHGGTATGGPTLRPPPRQERTTHGIH